MTPARHRLRPRRPRVRLRPLRRQQNLAQRVSALNLRGVVYRYQELMLVALGQPGYLFGFAKTNQAPLAVQDERVGLAEPAS